MHVALSVFRCLTQSSVDRFERALEQPQSAQDHVLDHLSQQMAQTEYGRHFELKSAQDFRQKLPIVDYDQISTWIHRQKETKEKILTFESPKFYERSSGSSGPAKYIPYTMSLQKSFSRMFGLWANDVLSHGPKLGSGKLFFSISPSFSQQVMTGSGASVGLEDDSEYLLGWMNWFLRPFLAVPRGLSGIREPEEFKLKLCHALVKANKLEVISVWNPSFLLMLMKYIRTHTAELGLYEDVDFQALWPQLKLISCWTGAAAAPLAREVQAEFPEVLIQGKGLLATEAPMTLPWIKSKGYVPLVDEVFYEFETEEGDVLGISDLELGAQYRIIISQKGGLCRYRMGDQVKVTHLYRKTPCLEFMGRCDAVSDLVGEKLNEEFVCKILTDANPQHTGFQMLFPVRQPHDHYVLLLDRCCEETDSLAIRIEKGLQRAHHYQHARLLEQLGACRVIVRENASDLFLEHEQQRGLKLGDIKHRMLFTEPLSNRFMEAIK